MLGDKRFWIGGRSSERWQVSTGAHIPEGDADIPQEPPALNPLDRRASEKGAELRVVECKAVTQRHLGGRSRRECCLARNRGEAIPRAGIKTVVATINAIANQRP